MNVNVDTVQGDDSADLENNAETDESENGQNQKNVLGASNIEETPLAASSVVHVIDDGYVDQYGYTFKAVQMAITNLNSGGTIFLDGGHYYGSGSPIDVGKKAFTMYGGRSPTDTTMGTLDANYTSAVTYFHIENGATLQFDRVIITHGWKDWDGSASTYGSGFVGMNDGTVMPTFIIRNSIIEENIVNLTSYTYLKDVKGVGLYIKQSKFNLRNVTINSNKAISNTEYHASATISYLYGQGTVDNCTFKNGQGTVGSGLQILRTGTAGPNVINNCKFINNTAYSSVVQHGAALCIYHNTVLNNSEFINNSVIGQGGAVTTHQKGTISNCKFINNTATTFGGAITTGFDEGYDGGITIDKCYFEGNQAPKGGAVQLIGNNVVISNSEFYNNSAIEGGAAYIVSNKCTISNSQFYGNNATYNLDSKIPVEILSNGSAKISYNDMGTNRTMYLSTLGGAVFISGDNAKISNNAFEHNIADVNEDINYDGLGGAIYVAGSKTTTNNNIFNHNVARNGSAIYTDGNNFNLVNDTFEYNQAYSYLLITTAVPEESYYNEADINVTVVHVGGDNIINAIYNKAAYNQIHFTNVHYTDSRHGNTTTGSTSVTPVKIEDSNNGEKLYQYDHEDCQNITLIITRQEDGEVVFNDTVVTDIYGIATAILPVGLKKGVYTVYAEHPEDWNYKKITNTTRFTINYSLKDNKTVSNETPYYGTEVDFNLTIYNDANVVYNDSILVVDDLPDGLEYVDTIWMSDNFDVISGPVLSNNRQTITWNITNVTAKSSAIITVRVKVTKLGNLTNNLTIDGAYRVNATVTPKPYVDISVNKTSDKTEYFVDEIAIFTIVVSNANNGTTATNVNMTDVLPVEFEYINDTANGAYNPTTGIWTIGTLANGTNKTIKIYARAKTIAKNVTNIAVVNCSEDEWDYNNSNRKNNRPSRQR